MILRHNHSPATLLKTERLRKRDGGYILVMTALLLVPLLLMAGLSVDVGSWYNRASDMQKAADAGALAGVVWLPDVPTARAYAKEAAERNGFDDADPDISVSVERIGDRRLRVTIEDTSVGSFFYQNLGGNKIDLNRQATAEYLLPVPLGSPDNHFGNDPADSSYAQPNLWGNIHGVKTNSTKGDAFAPACSGSDNCGGTTNPDYRPGGYLYTIDVPTGVSGLDVQVWDAGLYDRGSDESVDTGDRRYTGTGSTTTVWTMYDADGTELNVDDNPVANSSLCNAGGSSVWTLPEEGSASTYKNKWVSICKRTGTVTPGRYLLRVQTTGNGSAANRYALRVNSTSTTKAKIAGFGDMSMFNNVNAGSSPGPATANFYLAEVIPEHRGKTFRINMYDPGEVSKVSGTLGTGTIQVIQPTGVVAPTCVGTTTSGSSTFTSGSTLTPCSFQSAVNGSAKYNGHWVTLDIQIPNDYTCTAGTLPGCWWKLRYIIDGKASDTTTWSAQVIGDPVHLIEE